MNAQGIERCEIMGDWYEDIRLLEEPAQEREPFSDQETDEYFQDYLARFGKQE